jgi:predicted nuclease of restriction endonuclease-like (RecB) superfamily
MTRKGKVRSEKVPTELDASFAEVVVLIQSARQRAYQAVNSTLVDLYWRVGEYVCRKIAEEAWGKGTVQNLAAHIQKVIPGIRGFSAQNLWRMRQFHEAYSRDEKLSTLLRELPWSHNVTILSRCVRPEEREFYIRCAVGQNWSFRRLEKEIDAALFERHVLSPPKMSPALTRLHPSAPEVFKDGYVLDFLNLPEPHSESDLQRGLVHDIRGFLQALGPDFCFIGEEYRLQVGGKDFFLDLLFFHRGLKCLIAFDLKMDDFKPEYLGKLEFYLEALDRDVRKPDEKPSVGVLLCKSKDSEVVEYALSRSLSPAVVAQYQTQLPEKNVLQRKLLEFYELETARKGESNA